MQDINKNHMALTKQSARMTSGSPQKKKQRKIPVHHNEDIGVAMSCSIETLKVRVPANNNAAFICNMDKEEAERVDDNDVPASFPTCLCISGTCVSYTTYKLLFTLPAHMIEVLLVEPDDQEIEIGDMQKVIGEDIEAIEYSFTPYSYNIDDCTIKMKVMIGTFDEEICMTREEAEIYVVNIKSFKLKGLFMIKHEDACLPLTIEDYEDDRNKHTVNRFLACFAE